MTRLIVSCEHASRRVPGPYRPLFAGAEHVLDSHRGWDPGALGLARRLARRLDAPLFHGTVSRLLVDLNRSLHHPRLFSEFSRELDEDARRELLDRVYRPYRERFADALEERLARGPVLHLSIHSFTPVFEGRERRVDLGLLYDPSRTPEVRLCRRWVEHLRREVPGLRLRRNAPYRGAADGHCTALRRRHPETAYRGVEIEVSQRLLADDEQRRTVTSALVTSLNATLRP
jgi:predicted N-formylglutamate amidohydrolase